MAWDESKKEQKLELIAHYTKLLEMYNMDHRMMVQDLRMTAEMVDMYKNRLRMIDVAKEIIKHRLRQLGVKTCG